MSRYTEAPSMSLDKNNKEIKSPEHQIINHSNLALAVGGTQVWQKEEHIKKPTSVAQNHPILQPST